VIDRKYHQAVDFADVPGGPAQPFQKPAFPDKEHTAQLYSLFGPSWSEGGGRVPTMRKGITTGFVGM
jgi:hypothetical protein